MRKTFVELVAEALELAPQVGRPFLLAFAQAEAVVSLTVPGGEGSVVQVAVVFCQGFSCKPKHIGQVREPVGTLHLFGKMGGYRVFDEVAVFQYAVDAEPMVLTLYRAYHLSYLLARRLKSALLGFPLILVWNTLL